MKVTTLFKDFFNSEQASGLILVFCTLFSLVLSNSGFGPAYHHFWQWSLAGNPLEYWVNDGLMTIFFLLIGLELEREVYQGELSNPKEALLPMMGALGGMIVPAGIFLFLNYGQPSQSGAGIPMATDIAFAIGILSLLGKRVPTSLKVFLTALAVIDDLGAILVIAIFYTKTIAWTNLLLSLLTFGILLTMNRLKVRNLVPYLALGGIMWYFMLHSGVHATITGVLLAFAIPFGNGNRKSTSYILQSALHKPVAFIILPIFALANTAIMVSGNLASLFSQAYALGVSIGLVVGKPVGIFLFAYLAVKLRLCRLPSDATWFRIFSVGILGGIGFTMSIFITLLAFNNQQLIDNTKIVILLSSSVAALAGLLALHTSMPKKAR